MLKELFQQLKKLQLRRAEYNRYLCEWIGDIIENETALDEIDNILSKPNTEFSKMVYAKEKEKTQMKLVQAKTCRDEWQRTVNAVKSNIEWIMAIIEKMKRRGKNG